MCNSRRPSVSVEPRVARDGRSSTRIFLALFLSILCSMCTVCYAKTHGQAVSSPDGSITLIGILLVSDWRCDEWPADVAKDKQACPEGSSQWGLITATKQYSVRGNTSELKKYERRRVAVTGTVTATSGDVPVDKLEVQSIASTAIDENQFRALIEQLRSDRWTDPENLGNPTMWEFHFTPPMIQILQAGPTAQDLLLQYLGDLQIKDHIIVLLGGIGDEKGCRTDHQRYGQSGRGTRECLRP